MLHGDPHVTGKGVVIYVYIKQEGPPGRDRTRPRDTFLRMCIETQGRSIEKHIKEIINHRLITE